MTQLIVFRAIQGLGAGAIIPLGMTIVGELYSLEERARTQAMFSGVWGLASVAGPLVGGYITDAVSWRWVFYLNLPFGIFAAAIIALAYPASGRVSSHKVDWLGAGLLFGSVTALLVALSNPAGGTVVWLVVTSILVAVFVAVERRTPEPILPLDLFGDRLISRTLIVVFMTGVAMFGAIAFVPLFVQGVMGGTATQAGQALTPLFLGWVGMSVVGARVTVRAGYRPVAVTGTVLLAIGFVGLAMMRAETTRTFLLFDVLLLGCGMGLSMLSLLLAVQHGVDRSRLGIATSLNQFSRSIGAAVGVALMGALLARELVGIDLPGGLHGMPGGEIRFEGAARLQFATALEHVFAAGAAVSALAVIASFRLPPVDFTAGVPAGTGEIMLEAEMTNLAPDTEPRGVRD